MWKIFHKSAARQALAPELAREGWAGCPRKPRLEEVPIAVPISNSRKEKGPGIAPKPLFYFGAPCATRTRDHLIKSQMLYRLS